MNNGTPTYSSQMTYDIHKSFMKQIKRQSMHQLQPISRNAYITRNFSKQPRNESLDKHKSQSYHEFIRRPSENMFEAYIKMRRQMHDMKLKQLDSPSTTKHLVLNRIIVGNQKQIHGRSIGQLALPPREEQFFAAGNKTKIRIKQQNLSEIVNRRTGFESNLLNASMHTKKPINKPYLIQDASPVNSVNQFQITRTGLNGWQTDQDDEILY